jgi:serine/threonine-protein kinase
LSIDERIQLFLQVCDAVTYAHRSLIVHRDLKPSNILVTADGTPKLLDFGIAKLLDDDVAEGPVTSASMRLMTPEYASPEQARGAAITIATDVYSLGVLLFEILTGARPYRFAAHDAQHVSQVISLEEPPKPSTLVDPRVARQLKGDLDTIVLTALHKDPARRYATVEQLSDDLRRYRDGHPISARPATWRYRAGRFLSRHRYGVATAAVVLLITAGFGTALALSARRTARERDAAERVTALLVDMFSASDPAQARGGSISARELLDRAAARIEQNLPEQPEVRAQLLDAVGSVYFSLGVWEPAQRLLGGAVTARNGVGEGASLRAAATLHRLADVMLWRGLATEAAPLVATALRIRREALGGHHPDVAASLALQARANTSLGRPWSEIEPLHLQAIGIWRETGGAYTPDVAVALVQLARGRSGEGQFDGAISAARESLAIRQRAFGDDHPLTLESLVTLAQAVHQSGRAEESEPISREVMERRRKLYHDDNHPFVHQAVNQLAWVLADEGRLAEAEPLSRLAAERSRSALGIFNGTASNLRVLGTILEDQGRRRDAEAAYREAIDVARKAPNAEPQLGLALANLARLEVGNGRAAAAAPLAEEAVAVLRARFGPRHFQVAPALLARADVLQALNRTTDAEAAFRETLAIQRAVLPAGHPAVALSQLSYGGFLLEQRRLPDATAVLGEAFQAQRSLPKAHWSNAFTQCAYGAALRAAGHPDGQAMVNEGLARLAALFPAADPHVREARRLAGLF